MKLFPAAMYKQNSSKVGVVLHSGVGVVQTAAFFFFLAVHRKTHDEKQIERTLTKLQQNLRLLKSDP